MEFLNTPGPPVSLSSVSPITRPATFSATCHSRAAPVPSPHAPELLLEPLPAPLTPYSLGSPRRPPPLPSHSRECSRAPPLTAIVVDYPSSIDSHPRRALSLTTTPKGSAPPSCPSMTAPLPLEPPHHRRSTTAPKTPPHNHLCRLHTAPPTQ
jgi:hypothetical protein